MPLKGQAELKKARPNYALKYMDGSTVQFDGVFLALGIATASDFANKLGVARTGPQNAFLVANPLTGETNVKGIYAAEIVLAATHKPQRVQAKDATQQFQ